MKNIKELINAINNEYTDAKGTIYTENDGDVDIKEALSLLSAEVTRLQAIETEVNEKEDLTYLARTLACEAEGRFSGVKTCEVDSDGVDIDVYCDFWDFSGGTNDYHYSWEELRDINNSRQQTT